MAVDAAEALQELYRQRAELLAYIVVITRSLHLAEDVFQEVAVLVVRKADTIPELAALAGWVRVAARLEALKSLRRGRRLEPLTERVLDALDRDWDGERAGADPRTIAALRACLAALPPPSRELLACRYAEGCSGEQLAARVGKSVNAVYLVLSRLHRVLASCIRQKLVIEEAR